MIKGARSGRTTGARALLWTGSEAFVNIVTQVVGAFVVARIIGAEEVGVGALAVSFYAMFVGLVNGLGQDTMVQVAELSDDTAAAYLGLVSIISACAALIFCVAGPLLKGVIDDARLPMMCVALAPGIFLNGYAGVIHGVLARHRVFRPLTLRALIGQTIGVASATYLAEFGLGAWAMVVQQAVSTLVGVTVLVASSGTRPRLVYGFGSSRPILRVAWPWALNSLVWNLRYRLFVVFIGGRLGAAALGQTHVAFRLADNLRDLLQNAVGRIHVPAFGELRGNRSATRVYYKHGAFLFAAAGCLVMGALYLGLPFVVRQLMGEDWMAVVPASRVLVVLGVMSLATNPGQSLQVAHGYTRSAFVAACISLGMLAVLDPVIRPTSPTAAAILWLVTSLPSLAVTIWVSGRILGTDWIAPLAPIAIPVTITTAAVAVVSTGERWLWNHEAVEWIPGIVSLIACCVLIAGAHVIWVRKALVNAVRELRKSDDS